MRRTALTSTAIVMCASALVLAGCSDGSSGEMAERVTSVDVEETSADAAMAEEELAEGESGETDIPVSAPQIAYSYSLGFRLPMDRIRSVQETHANLCDKRGPKTCRIISMQQANDDGDYASGDLQLAVVASEARAFAKELETSSGKADGKLVSSSMTGEDLSKQIVDTEARLRSRVLLRDRLMDILATRSGSVAELVEAERGVAQVNQEIDQARSWLEEMRGRVAFSQMTISYEAGSPSAAGNFAQPIAGAWNSLGGIFGSVIAALMMLFAGLLPIAILAGLVFAAWRSVRSRRNAADAPPENGRIGKKTKI